ncbi:hypothetical protein [Cohnella hongkongensis]|uniref:ABC transporter ATP-binding protein n=1 Tax=Cohnella hongkongensis TaxID=178337 RepID=A0ABV9FIZ8_9BACL
MNSGRGDERIREKLLASMGDLARRPDAPAMLFVTHPIGEVLPVFGKSLLIRRGRIFEQGALRQAPTTGTQSPFCETGVRSDWRNDFRAVVGSATVMRLK